MAEAGIEAFGEFADDPIRIMAEIGLRSLPNMADAIPLAVVGAFAAGPYGFALGMGLGSKQEHKRRHGETSCCGGVGHGVSPRCSFSTLKGFSGFPERVLSRDNEQQAMAEPIGSELLCTPAVEGVRDERAKVARCHLVRFYSLIFKNTTGDVQ